LRGLARFWFPETRPISRGEPLQWYTLNVLSYRNKNDIAFLNVNAFANIVHFCKRPYVQRLKLHTQILVKGILQKNGWKKFTEKTIIITSEVIIMMYVQLHHFAF
jgi:hypothetical protein